MKFDVSIEGAELLLAKLASEPDRFLRGAKKGLYRSGLEIMARSQEIVPVGGPPTSPYDPAPGTLKASGKVLDPTVEDDKVTVELGYGDAAAAYAVRQHEDLTFQHKPGQSAKFLERPLLEDVPNIPGRISEAINEEQ